MSFRRKYLHGCLHLILTALICYLLFFPDTSSAFPSPAEPEEIPAPLALERIEPKTVVDQHILLWDDAAKATLELPMEEYVLGVLAAEMPASYADEALKAQAVSARTYVLQGMLSQEKRHTDGAAVCTSSAHCQAYISEEVRRERWGKDFEYYETKLANAVAATAGEVLTYEGQPIVVLYHSTSGGMTEDVEHVYSQALPYLRSVESPGEEGSSKYASSLSFTYKALAEKLNTAFPGADLKASALKKQLNVLNRYKSGRVETVQLGNVTATGVQLRRALGLNSANFSFSFGLTGVTVNVIGYGHGVGMSQVGANIMAQNGKDYISILTHYYTGVTLMQQSDFAPYLQAAQN